MTTTISTARPSTTRTTTSIARPSTSTTRTTTSSIRINDINEMYSINANNCGQRPLVRNQTVLKIVGGVQALNGDWPWQIIMFYNGGFTCGGSLINSLWVVTAGN
jgi:hypothetical protein